MTRAKHIFQNNEYLFQGLYIGRHYLDRDGLQNRASNFIDTYRQIGMQLHYRMTPIAHQPMSTDSRSTYRIDQGRTGDCTPNLSDEVQECTQQADLLGDCECQGDGRIDVPTCRSTFG